MTELIGAISLISLVINVLIYRRIIATYPLGSVDELEPAHHCCEAVIGYLESPKEEKAHEPIPEPKTNPESYQAWTNRKGIPMIPPTTPPKPIVKTPDRGPLARPDGFV